jgi:uncharacterized protein (TIGR01777 family)
MKKKTVAMAGTSGLIGTYLSGYLREYELLNISRNDLYLKDDEFAEKYRKSDIVINLSGAPVIRRWTKKNRKEIVDSRILTTRKLGCIMEYSQEQERLYMSASAIGIYNDEDIHTEESAAWGKGFMAEVVHKWEAEVFNLESHKTKVCIMRTGVVMAESGGMLASILPLFRLGLGARIGKGDQYFSWIHIKDLARAIDYIIKNNKHGIYNMTAPGFCTNWEFTKSLGHIIKKPARFILPKILFYLIYGKGAAIVTGGQAVVPARLIEEGFYFKYQYVDKALENIVN